MSTITTVSVVSAQLDASGFQRGAEQVNQSNAAIAASADKAAKGTQRVQSNFDKLAATLDGSVRAQAAYEAGQDKLTAAVERGYVTAERAAQMTERLRDAQLRAEVAEATRTTTLDRLRAAYTPLGAAQQSYANALAEISIAERDAGLSAQEAAAARQRAAQSLQAQTDAVERARVQALHYVSANDQLRARLIPLVAAEQQHAGMLKEIADAEIRGILTTQEATAARLRAKAALDAATASHTTAAAGVTSFGMKLQSAGYQAQDFAVQIAGGQSALVALGQQGSQFASSFGVGGALIGAGLAMLSLIPLFIDGKTAAEKFAETIKKIEDNYSGLTARAEAYRTGLDTEANQIRTLTTYYTELTEAQRGLERVKIATQQAELAERAKTLRETIGRAGVIAPDAASDVLGGNLLPDARMMQASTAIRQFAAAGDLSRESFSRLIVTVNELATATGKPTAEWKKLLDTLLGFETQVVSVEDKQKLLDALTQALAGNATAAGRALGSMGDSIRSALNPLDELNRKLGESVAKLAAFRSGGSAGLTAADRDLRIATETETQRKALAAYLNTPEGGALNPAEATERANAAAVDIRNRVAQRIAAEEELKRQQALDDAAEQRRREEAARRAPLGQRQAIRSRSTASDEADRLFDPTDPRRDQFIADRVAAAAARDTATAPHRRDNQLIAETQAAGYLAIAKAAEESDAAVLRANASLEAAKKIAQGATGSEQELAQAILERNAAQDAAKGAERVRLLREEEDASRRVAAAQLLGPRAAQQEALNRQIQEATRQYRAEAEVTKDPAVRASLEATVVATREIMQNRKADAELDAANRDLNRQGQQMQALQDEAAAIGLNADARERELAAVKAMRELYAQGRDLQSAESQRIVQNARDLADANRELKTMQNSWSEIANAGEKIFDRLGDSISKAFLTGKPLEFKAVMKDILAIVVQTVVRMALIQPALNAIFGGTRGTFMGLAGNAGGNVLSSLVGGGLGLGGTVAIGPGVAMAGPNVSGAAQTAGGAGVNMLPNQVPGTGYLSQGYNYASDLINYGMRYPLYTTGTAEAIPQTAAYYGESAQAAQAGYGSSTGIANASADSVLNSPSGLGGTVGSALGGTVAVVGGGYNVYQGLERGGIGGYTQAAGGALSAVGGIGMITGLFSLGPYGWIAAAILTIAGMLMDGQKPSNREGNFTRNLDDGSFAFDGQTGDKWSFENRDAARRINDQIVGIVDRAESTFGIPNMVGLLKVGVGDRDGLYSEYTDPVSGVVGRAVGGRDEASIKTMVSAMVHQIFMANFSKLPEDLATAAAHSDWSNLEEVFANLDFASRWRDSMEKLRGTAKITKDEADAAANGIAEMADQLRTFRDKADSLGLDPGLTHESIAVYLRQQLGLDETVSNASALEHSLGLLAARFDVLGPMVQEFGLTTGDVARALQLAKDKLIKGVADQYDAALRQVRGETYIDQAMGITNDFKLGAGDALAAGRDPNLLAHDRTAALIAQLDYTQLAKLAEGLKGFDDNMAAWAQFASQVKRGQAIDDIRKADVYAVREASGLGYVNTAADIRLQWWDNRNNPLYMASGRDPTDLYTAQAKQLFAGLTDDQLQTLADSIRGFDDVMADMAIAAKGQKDAADALQAAAESLSPNVVNLRDYAHSLRTSADSPLGARTQYEDARNSFNSVAWMAANGDAASYRKLQEYSDDFLAQSRNVNGTSGADYFTDFQRVISALEGAGNVNVDTLTASVMREETRTQTQTLVEELAALRGEVAALRRETTQGSATPARLVA